MEMDAGLAEPLLDHMILAGQMGPSLYPNPGSANLSISTNRPMRPYQAAPSSGGLPRHPRRAAHHHTPYCVLDIETAGAITQPPDTYELLFTGVKFEQRRAVFRSSRRELDLLANFINGFAGIVVTFNGSGFDLPILRHAIQRATGRTIQISNHYDLLSVIVCRFGRRVSLDALARENLRIGKSKWDHRRNKEIWQSSPEQLIAHNQEDLDLTARLIEVVLQGQPLQLDGKSVLLPLKPFKPLQPSRVKSNSC